MRKKEIEFIVISHNCWGAEIYKDLGVPYNTPFIGLFVPTSCYVKLCERLEFYLSQPLNFRTKSKYEFYNHFRDERKDYYPIGLLDDVEIHFLHYQNENEAVDKWNRRLSRMHKEYDKYFFQLSEREIFDMDDLKRFDILPFKNKVILTANKYESLTNSIQIKEFEKNKDVIDGKSLYQISKYYFQPITWVTTGRKKHPSFFRSLLLNLRIIKKLWLKR